MNITIGLQTQSLTSMIVNRASDGVTLAEFNLRNMQSVSFVTARPFNPSRDPVPNHPTNYNGDASNYVTPDPDYKIVVRMDAVRSFNFYLKDVTNQPAWTNDETGAQAAVLAIATVAGA